MVLAIPPTTIEGVTCPASTVSLTTPGNILLSTPNTTYILAVGTYELNAMTVLNSSDTICVIGTGAGTSTLSITAATARHFALYGGTLGLQGLTLRGTQPAGSWAGGIVLDVSVGAAASLPLTRHTACCRWSPLRHPPPANGSCSAAHPACRVGLAPCWLLATSLLRPAALEPYNHRIRQQCCVTAQLMAMTCPMAPT